MCLEDQTYFPPLLGHYPVDGACIYDPSPIQGYTVNWRLTWDDGTTDGLLSLPTTSEDWGQRIS